MALPTAPAFMAVVFVAAIAVVFIEHVLGDRRRRTVQPHTRGGSTSRSNYNEWPHSEQQLPRERTPDHTSPKQRTTNGTSHHNNQHSQQDGSPKCKICYDNPTTHMINPCGHTLCKPCGDMVKATTGKCHVCRKAINSFRRFYL